MQEQTEIRGRKIRLRLLAALLRFADALDQDHERVNMDILQLVDIPDESKLYWWIHYYIQSIDVENGYIKIILGVPEAYRENKIIIQYLENYVRKIIKKHLLDVNKALHDNGYIFIMNLKSAANFIPPDYGFYPMTFLGILNDTVQMIADDRLQELTIRTGAIWFVDGVCYSDNKEVVKCLGNMFRLIEEGEYLKAVEEIKRGRILTKAPMEKVIFLINAGNVYSIIGKLDDAMRYYEEAKEVSEREELQEIYKKDILKALSAALGNIGLIYKAKGDLDKALKYFEKALEIFVEIKALSLVGQTLVNIAAIFFERRSDNERFKCLGKAISLSPSVEAFNKTFSALLRIIRNMISYREWERLEAISSIYASEIINDKDFVGFLKAIHEYALWMKTSKDVNRRSFEEKRQRLNPFFKERSGCSHREW